MAKAFDCQLHIVENAGFLRYPKCLFQTLFILLRTTSRVVFVQNPSMILATLVCLYKKLFQAIVIVDRHSTFKFKSEKGKRLSYAVYRILNSFTLKTADITIVTNKHLAGVVEKSGGTAYVLPDRIPEFREVKSRKLDGKFNVLFVCSYAKDEPVLEVLEAMRQPGNTGVHLYISGNHRKLATEIVEAAPENVIFTGFLSEEEYVSLLHSVDAVMVLTTAEHTLMCGCYEAVSASKPLITSDRYALREYFKGCIFVENNRDGISRGIAEVVKSHAHHSAHSKKLKESINRDWAIIFNGLEQEIKNRPGTRALKCVAERNATS